MAIRRAAATALAVVVLPGVTATGAVAGAAAGKEAPRPVISKVAAFDAPAGGKGGIMSPYVYCTGGEVEPVVRMVLTERSTGHKRTFRWTGALPGMHFPRVAPGYHRAWTHAECGDTEATRTQTVLVKEKTARSTMSWAEYASIERGMTRAEVRAIVGNDGRSPSTDGGRTTRTYDNMPFWAWSTVTYRHGRVVDKEWDIDHD